MNATFNNIGFGSLVAKYGIQEKPRRVAGVNEGKSINGTAIDDTVAVKFDPTFTLRPLTLSEVQTVWNMAVLMGFYQLTYTNAAGLLRTFKARLTVTAPAKLTMQTNDRTLYEGIVLSFEQQ